MKSTLMVFMLVIVASVACVAQNSSVYDPTASSPPLVLTPLPKACVGGEDVLQIQDNVPWFAAAGQDPSGADVTELIAQNKKWCSITSSAIGSTNLAPFSEILIAAAQTQTFYNNLFSAGNIDSLTAWVTTGGVLSANLADRASGPGAGGNWDGNTFVGGVTHVFSPSSDDDIATSHPLITNALPCPSGNCAGIVDTGVFTDLDGWGFSDHGYFTSLPAGTTIILTQGPGVNLARPVAIEYAIGAGRVVANLNTVEWRYVGDFGSLPQNKKLLANDIAYQDFIAVLPVPVDIKPTSCPNPINTNDQGVIPVAILGTATFDATQVDPSTVLLVGTVSPLRSALEDVATPFSPFTGKSSCTADCNTLGPDGFTDLVLHFDAQAVIAAVGPVTDGQCLVVKLTGKLFNGRKIKGEDVVIIINKK